MTPQVMLGRLGRQLVAGVRGLQELYASGWQLSIYLSI